MSYKWYQNLEIIINRVWLIISEFKVIIIKDVIEWYYNLGYDLREYDLSGI